MINPKASAILLAALLASCVPAAQVPAPAGQSSSQAASLTPLTETGAAPVDVVDAIIPETGSAATLTATNERWLPGGIVEIGKIDAPLVMTVFTNFSCSYCRDFHEDIMRRLLAEYVDRGELRINLVTFDLAKYAESEQSALNFLCAAKQGKGLAMSDLLFSSDSTPSVLRARTQEMALDGAAFQACLSDPAMHDAYLALQTHAAAMHVSVLPTYYLGAERLTGLPDYADVRGKIEELKMNN